MLADLPFRVQVDILAYLDSRSVYKACFVSHRLNEAASRVMYTEPVLQGKCCEEKTRSLNAALARRPHLAAYVKALILVAESPKSMSFPHMPNLHRLAFVGCYKCQARWEEGNIFRILRQLYDPSIKKTVSISGMGESPDGTLGLCFSETETGSPKEQQDLWSYVQSGIITHLDIMASSPALPNNISSYIHLKKLDIQSISHMEPILLALTGLSILEDLKLECTSWSYTLPREEWTALNLPRLKSIRLLTGQYFIGEVAFGILCDLFNCVASQSFLLEDIDLGSTLPRLNPPFAGGPLAQGIAKRNHRTLRLLKIPAASLPSDILSELLANCRLLREFQLSVSRSDLYTLSLCLRYAEALRELHLSFDLPDEVSNPYEAMDELFASPNSLRQLTLFVPAKYGWGEDVVWERYWEYDRKKQSAILYLKGPLKLMFKPVPMPKMHGPS